MGSFVAVPAVKPSPFRTLVAACFSLAFCGHVYALSIGDSHDLGLISKNYPADPLSSAGFINILLDQPLGGAPTLIGSNTYTRTTNDPLGGAYPDAVFALDLGATTTIKLGSGDLYLLAKYDGPNWGSEVWYVGNLTGTVTIPKFPTKNKYAVSHVFLYTGQNTAARPVPEGGSTVVLFGLALGGVAVTRRFVRKPRKSGGFLLPGDFAPRVASTRLVSR